MHRRPPPRNSSLRIRGLVVVGALVVLLSQTASASAAVVFDIYLTTQTNPSRLYSTLTVTGAYHVQDWECVIYDNSGNQVATSGVLTSGTYTWSSGTSGTSYKIKWKCKYKETPMSPLTDYTSGFVGPVVFP